MSYNMDDILGGFRSGTPSHYTEEEIEAAKKRQKKHGGTFMENLEAVTSGQKKPDMTMDFDSLHKAESTLDALNASILELSSRINRDFGAMAKGSATNTGFTDTPAATQADAQVSLAAQADAQVSAAAQADARVSAAAVTAEGTGRPASSPTGEEAPAVALQSAQALNRFAGLTDALKEKVFGQDDFLRKMVIAFKRPLVTERDDNDALNSIYITGPACTGKHYTLSLLVEELYNRRIIPTPEIHTMDLSLYPLATSEKLFLQDLYSAIRSRSSVIAFENYEACHISMLARLSDLVATGECKLSERYVMQNGQLVNVSNAFAGNAVGSFEAKNKYLVFLSTRPVDKLAGTMGATFVNALGDICSTAPLDEESMKRILEERRIQFLDKCKKQLAYELTMDETFSGYLLAQSSKGRGLKGILDACADTMRALAELRLERDDLPPTGLILTCDEGNPVLMAGETKVALSEYLPGGYNGELEAVKAEMESIVGLKAVKEYIYSLEEYFGVQKRRKEAGLKAGEVNKHMIFTGNPGTGKTTIARIVSKYLKAIGVLSGGQLVEVSRADLVGRYVGHTAPLVNQVIKSALGGVLFIDEAYSLHRGQEDSFGLEAIDTLVKGIEDNRDDLIVILAGYSNEMETFLESNSGLKSRFPNIIDFPDYSGEELLAIARLTAKSKGYRIDEAAELPLLNYFNIVQATRAMDAGNGRLVRNKIESAILNQSKRLVAEPESDISLLLEKDFDLDDNEPL